MPTRLLATILAVCTFLFMSAAAAEAACGGKLGTARTLKISAKRHSAIQGYEKRLGLRDKEVILTFDDGPLSNTSKVLSALANECVRATFFVVGRHVARTPAKVRNMRRRGHTIAHHTWNHENLPRLSNAAMSKAIDRGISAVNKALHGTSSSRARNPFFRYPYLAKSKRTRAMLKRKGLIEVGTNIDTGDWRRQSPSQLHDRIMAQLKRKRRGIVLMHDIQPRTAAMLPRLLRSMRKAGYKVVHMVPAGKAAPTAVEVAALEPEKPVKKRKASKRKAVAKKRKPSAAKSAAVVKVAAKRSSKRTKSRSSLKKAAAKSRAKARRTAKRSKSRKPRRIAKRTLRARFIIQ